MPTDTTVASAGLPMVWLMVMVVLLIALAALALWFGTLYLRERHRRELLSADLDAATTRLGDYDGQLPPGLVPRTRFDAELDTLAHKADREGRHFCVLFVNFDKLGHINERHGFGVGDAVVHELASRMITAAGPKAVVAPMSGDEYLVLLNLDLAQAQSLAARMVKELARPCVVEGAPEHIGCSVGVAAYPEHGSRQRLVSRAHAAMRAVKLAGGNAHMVFEPRMETNTREQAELVADLRLAVARGELELFYQPKIDASSLQITAAEALLRWHHPKRGMVSPAVFVPLAERHGLINAIGHWVIEDACRQAAQWRDQGLRMRVAINVSAHQMREDELVERLEATLKLHGLQPARFTCEITETVAMENTEVTRRTFAKMRQAGLHVSIDDFGVGQNSLSYLRQLPAAELKVDASFVQDIEFNRDSRSIVDALVKLAHALGLRVVAEGVETEGQRDVLVQLGCDELQGYLFAKPMSAKALGLWALTDDSAGPGAPSQEFRASLFEQTQPMVPPDMK